MEKLEILYRDEWLVAVHKPPGLLTHRTPLAFGETRFALQMLRDQIGQHVYPAHRLDRGTSGVLLFALDSDTARRLGASFEGHQVDKCYRAIVRGHPAAEGWIDHPITRQRDDAEWVGEDSSFEAQEALTYFKSLEQFELPVSVDRYPHSRYALLELVPKTGRRHQLRRHLKHIAHPIIGDATHGKGKHNRLFAQLFGVSRLLLCCTRLTLPHPRHTTPLQLDAEPEPGFMAVLAGLRQAGAAHHSQA